MQKLLNRHALSFAAMYCLGVLAVTTCLYGQAATASISGRVMDASGAVITDAAVTIKNIGTTFVQTVNTDTQGRYSAPDLPIGTYQVQTTKTGFQTAVRSNIVLEVGSSPVVDFQLAVGQTTQTLEVSAEVTQVETTTSAVSSLVNQTQMRELPLNGRNFEQLILLAPGVATYPAGGNSALTSVANAYSISGTRPEGYANMLDGEDMLNWWQRNAGGNVTGTSLGIEGIAEFRTLTGTYGAEYGGNGGAINAVSKSGTNVFHGSAYEFFRNSALDARGFFDGRNVPPFRKNQFGASVGGPIKRNKVFFFANYEGVRQVLDTTYVNFVPSATLRQGITGGVQYQVNPASAAMLALYPAAQIGTANPDVGVYNYVGAQNSPENFFLGRVDWQISDKDAFFARYQIDYGNRTTFAGWGLWPTFDVTHNNFLTAGERHIFSPTLINQFSVSWTRPLSNETQPTLHDALQIFTPARQDVYVAMPSGLSPLGSAFIDPFQYMENKYTERDDLTWIHGSHTIAMGIGVRRDQLNYFADTYGNGFYLFLNLPSFLTGNPFEFTGAPNGGTDSHRGMRTIMLTPYIQDDWKVNNRLTVNIGLRYDWESNPVEVNNKLHNVVGPPFGTGFVSVPHAFATNPANHNFDPRVGVAWDVFGDHKTSVRAGFGIFHDVYQTYTFASAYKSNPPFLTENQFFTGGDPNFPTPFVGGGGVPLLSQTTGVYYGTHQTPYTMEYSFSVQRELPWSTLLTVGYVGTNGVHLLAFHDFNAPLPTTDANGVMHFVHQSGVGANGSPIFAQNARPYPAFGALDMTDTSSHSSYNALQLSVEHKLSSDLVFQGSYTYSHCIDSAYTFGGLGFNNGTSAITNPFAWDTDRGNCSYDLRHVISANAVYLLPFKGNRFKEGWQFTIIQAWHTGVPFSLNEGDQAFLGNNFDTERPNLVAGCDIYANQSITEWYNPACFRASPYGTIGNLGRNNLVGPGYVDTDFGVMKNTRISERFSLQFRAELFNIFNHSNFALPPGGAFTAGSINTGYQATPSTTANRITAIVGNSRQTQFSLKLLF
ncbi:MAG TPA: carboxypeptidase regulatory-like domain-containing protein [Bryobacteraceae bacterium]|nr:carboxypeptidase regulatory-like domain-containing protein [Bryobacteraceae bacterium]